jgi:hypothetical protein
MCILHKQKLDLSMYQGPKTNLKSTPFNNRLPFSIPSTTYPRQMNKKVHIKSRSNLQVAFQAITLGL